jgi:TonB-linked SusC/RagA family outer membrane protein
MTRILSLFVVFMLSGVLAFAQNRVVTGTVKDDSGVPVQGATIYVGNRAVGFTDKDGKYSIKNVAPNAILRVADKAINSGTSAVVDFSVAKSTTELSTVTVTSVTTALGIRRQPKELGYAATTLTGGTINKGKATGVAQALNGKVSSLSVSTTSSGVFDVAKIRIRGIRSLTGDNNPMLVVDGAPTPIDYLTSIAPEDIATQTILKGATAAAIYGTEAANGVIIITTKRGTGDNGISVSITSAVQFTNVAFFPKLQHQFGAGAGEIVNPDGSYAYIPYENQIYGPAFDGTIKEIGVRLEDGSIQSGPYSNLHASDKKNFYNTGTTLQNNISLSGKDFYLSVDDAVINGTVPDDKRRRTSFRFNGSKTGNKLSASYGINYILDNSNVLNEALLAGLSGTSYGGGLFFLVMQTGDNVPLLQYKDWKNNKFAQYSNYWNEFAVNPYWAIGNLRTIRRNDNFLANAELGYQIKPWLKATAKVSTELGFGSAQANRAPISVTDFAHATRNPTQFSNSLGSTTATTTTASRVNFDGYFSGETNAGKNLKIHYLAGGQVRDNRGRTVQAGGNNLVVPYLYNPSVRSGELTGGSNVGEWNSYALYGQLGFSFRDFLFIEAQARNEWDSRLLKDNRSFFYPAVNASFIATDAIPSIKNNVLNFLKIRGSYAKSGNVNLGGAAYGGAYQIDPTYGTIGGFPYGSNVGFTANQLVPDANLTPEFQYASEVGFELGLFKNNRVYLEATAYNSDNKDQILTVSKPFSTGYSAALANAARFRNYGIDLDLTLSPLINIGRARFDLKINAGYNNNEVKETFQNLDVITGGSGNFIQNSVSSPTINQIARVGGPAYSYQMTDYLRDPQGRVIVDANGLPSQAAALVVQGRSLPLWIVGATPSVTVGNISLSMTWDFKGGHNGYSGLGSDMDFSGISERSAAYGRQNFIFPNSVYDDGTGKYVVNTDRLTQDGNYAFWTGKGTNTGIATNYFYSAAALRLREINLAYNLPLKGKGLKNLTFAVIGRNLFLFVPKSNQWGDPEFNSGGENTYGISSSFQSPATRMMGLSINAQF